MKRIKLIVLSSILWISTAVYAEEWPARLEWAQPIALSTPLSGRISAVKVVVGDRVKPGQLLATLDARPYQARLKRARAEVTRLQAALTIAERDHTQVQELYDRTVASATELQDAQVRVTSAQALLQRAQADVLQAQLDLEYSQIRAPFGGIIVDRNIHPGSTVVNQLQATPLLILAKPDRYRVTASVPAAEPFIHLSVGDPVSIRIMGEAYTGQLERLQPQASGTLEISARFDTTHSIPRGSLARISLP